jgi:RNA polymerase sigma-70 factor, ECF subfamily
VDDAEIIKRIQAGDSESYSSIVEKYHGHLLNFIYRLLRDEQIVEDIGQDVFLNVYKSIRSFHTERGVPFSAWLFITARNRCISELRRKSRVFISIESGEDLIARERTPEQSASDRERLLAIHAALDQLPEPYRHTILQSLRGDSPEEIALSNKIAAGTVKSRLARARERMRLLLQENFGGTSHGQL